MLRSIYVVFFICWYLLGFGQYKTRLTVAQDGSGDYASIQAAIDASKSFPDLRIIIFIKKGNYREKIKIHSWNTRISLIGEDAANTIISWGDHFESINRGRNSTFHTATLWVQGADFRMENLTIENVAGPVGQAIALSIEADRTVVLNCRILGNQDTLYVAGTYARQYYKNCYIEGTTDFIFGQATALFEKCTIHSKSNSYVTAASTSESRKFGLVFIECHLTADEDVDSVYLGRPWRAYAKTAFIKCEMGAHIIPEGWDNWSNTLNESTVKYVEYANLGVGAKTDNRVNWSLQLSKKEAKKYRQEEILKPFLVEPFHPDL